MVFSSWQFVLIFLPVAFFGYFFLNRARLVVAGKLWLVIMSLYFYAYWNIAYLPLLLASIGFNYFVGGRLLPRTDSGIQKINRRWMLGFAIAANLALLGYFKYSNFFLENLNQFLAVDYSLSTIVLPLGISFFTFTQIAYLVDSYSGKAREYNFYNYMLFVTFFPHLIAGPILHHREMMSQFESRWALGMRYRNIVSGLFIFSIGLFKKVVLADTFAIWANAGFGGNGSLDFFSAWATSLSYTFQLYFDFSGYCDMAIGASLLFNIWLPINFNSPYKALSIQDFWRRWHITLSRFLRDYLYIPLGGNHCTNSRIYLNLMVTFVLGGIWHGASWMFVIWGALHGLALVVHRAWGNLGLAMPKVLAWLLTFNFVNLTWVFFRAENIEDAIRILRGMSDAGSAFGIALASFDTGKLAWAGYLMDGLAGVLPAGVAVNVLCFTMIAISFVIVSRNNSFDLMKSGVGTMKFTAALAMFCISMYVVMATTSTVFLYYNF